MTGGFSSQVLRMPDDQQEMKAQFANVTELLKNTVAIIKVQDARLKDPARASKPEEIISAFREVVTTLSQVVRMLALIVLKESKK